MTSHSFFRVLFFFLLGLLVHNTVAQSSEEGCNNEPQQYNCIDSGGFWNCDINSCCNCPNNMDSVSIIITLILTFIGIVSSCLLIAAYFRIKALRSAPGDLIIFIALSDLVQSIATVIMLFPALQYSDLSLIECEKVSFADNISLHTRINYNLMFYLYYMRSLGNSLKATRLPHIVYHIIPWVGTAVLLYINLQEGAFGLSTYGLCTLRTSDHITYQILVIVVFCALPAYTLYYTKKYIPKGFIEFDIVKEFLGYYRVYVIVSAVIAIFMACDDLLQMLMMPSYLNMSQNWQVMGILATTALILRALNAVVLSYVRLMDPTFKQYRYKLFCWLKKPEGLEQPILRDRAVSLDVAVVQQQIEGEGHIRYVQHILKVQAIHSVLSALQYYCDVVSKNPTPIGFGDDDQRRKFESQHIETYKISEEILKQKLPHLQDELTQNKSNIIEGMFHVYASGLFSEIINLDGMREQMGISLDLIDNFKRIVKAGIHSGGKSGEFFFFSADNKLIIKTITEEETRILIKILPDYSRHYQANPNSLIAQIYGLFAYERQMPYEKYYLILMRNINGYPTNCIERIYDLKGSTLGRITINPKQNIHINQLKFHHTLKDLDFDKYEKKLWFDAYLRGEFYEALKSDAEFLRRHHLIDYSLAIFIINKENFDQNSILKRDNKNLPDITVEKKKFYSMKSIKEPFYYHVGIIDFLTEYTCRKSLEKFTKKLAACNPRLDVSVQNPTDYAERFVRYMERNIF